MSRTRTTRPEWIRANDPTELLRREVHRHAGGRECTIDIPRTRARRWERECHMEIGWNYDGLTTGPTREDIRLHWWGPQRATERARALELARAYNTWGDVDETREPEPEQHRGAIADRWW